MVSGEEKYMRLLWLLSPEDSSRWEHGGKRDKAMGSRRQERFQSIIKWCLCYGAALSVSFFLAALH